MNNPRDWNSGLWLITRQTIIIAGCFAIAFGGCALFWWAVRTG